MHTEEWHADIEITQETVKKVLQEQFPSITSIENIQCIGEGWDNKIFLVDKNIIFRFPRRKAAVPLMERENIILNNLPIFLDIKIPLLKYQGRPTATYPFPCQGYEMIKGCSGYQTHLNEQDRSENIIILAKFLKQLHSIDADRAREMGAISQGSGSRANIDETIKILKERVDKIMMREIININMACLRDEINIACKLTLPEESCFVHGDLDCRHLIFDDKKITGIIDWGDTDITSRAVDLDIVWTFFPNSSHNKFFEIYGSVDPDTWKYARFLGLYCAFSLALYSIDLKDNLLFTESVNSIKRINANLIID
jgi:aminoglycoside phosphotransferase (APT) family kinase protein